MSRKVLSADWFCSDRFCPYRFCPDRLCPDRFFPPIGFVPIGFVPMGFFPISFVPIRFVCEAFPELARVQMFNDDISIYSPSLDITHSCLYLWGGEGDQIRFALFKSQVVMSGDLFVQLNSNKEILLAPQLKRSTVRKILICKRVCIFWWLFLLTFGADNEE